MYRLEKIKKEYRSGDESVKVLERYDLSITKGEFVAVCGVSGCGKSTLLNILGCLDIPDSGEYYINGVSVDYKNSKMLTKIRKENFGFIFQSYALMKKYTIFENMEMPLIARGIKKNERKRIIEKSIEEVGFDEPLSKYPHEISGGQQQRVAIARAVAMESPCILADEPTGALDEKNGKRVVELFLKLKERGHTIVMVTHDSRLAACADRIVYMRKESEKLG